MTIPVAYNLRNLVVRRTTTLMTVAGIALTVSILVGDLALVSGLNAAFRSSGEPCNILVMSKGSKAEVTSQVSRQMHHELQSIPGIAKSESGRPMASLEIVTALTLPAVAGSTEIDVTVRGIAESGIALRDGVTVNGRWFRSGHRELVVGSFIAGRYAGARPGSRLRFGRGEWEVVGIMDGRGTAIDSEIWGDLNQISSDFNRPNFLSSILLRASDAFLVPELIRAVEDDRRLNAAAMSERDYYESQTMSGAPLQYFGMFVAIVMGVGSAFAAMNTMYAAVARRTREIALLRVLGFSPSQILVSFLSESLLLSLAGGLLGCLAILPFNNFTAGLGNLVTFSHTAFQLHISAFSVLAGIAFALFIGVISGCLPARLAARSGLVEALRS